MDAIGERIGWIGIHTSSPVDNGGMRLPLEESGLRRIPDPSGAIWNYNALNLMGFKSNNLLASQDFTITLITFGFERFGQISRCLLLVLFPLITPIYL